MEPTYYSSQSVPIEEEYKQHKIDHSTTEQLLTLDPYHAQGI